jgi:PIN domain
MSQRLGPLVLKEFDEINLIVSRPIQSEIDNQKNKGRDRLGRKARETSSLFREIILGSEEFKEIRAATPIVRLFVRPELKVNAELSDRLNYQERDDQLVGTAHAFQCEHSDIDVRVLTDDTGPMASAKMVGLSVLPIPNNWLLPPENTETEKKINTLTQEVSRYKRAEPDFQLKWLNSSNEEISAINIEMIRYIEITKSQATELMAKIVERFPLSKDFGSNEPSERQSEIPVFGNLRMKEIFVPATAEEIAKYRDEYPKWLQCCEDIIRNYHKTQQQHAVAPSFTFQATNTGTRPAKHVLVTFFTKGDFSILPPTSGDKKKSKKEH